uniref:cytochrome P450 2J5-like isoform X2 n=1 Tax=Myxine glutinosa TaxID=7769 RepID=UPI00358EBE33
MLSALHVLVLVVLMVLSVRKLLGVIRSHNQRPAPEPPGPRPLPVLGNLLAVRGGQRHEAFMQLAERFGPVYTLWFGRLHVVLLCGYDVVLEALVKRGEEFSARPSRPLYSALMRNSGIVLANGAKWCAQRRLAELVLRKDKGGGSMFEWSTCHETAQLIQEMDGYDGKPFNPQPLIRLTTANLISVLLLGHRFETTDLTFQRLLQQLDAATQLAAGHWGQLYDAFPSLMHYLPGPHQSLFRTWESLRQFVRKEIASCRANHHKDTSQSYIELCLFEMQSTPGPDAAQSDEDDLIHSTLDLFMAGMDTSSATLTWALLYMVTHPDVQACVQTELDGVLGCGRGKRSPTLEDISRLHYTRATIGEVQRLGNVIPNNLPRQATQDMVFRGYFIAEGTMVLPLLTAVLRDPTQWKSPLVFNPKRFLDENGHFYKPRAFIPFSIGCRACPGEDFAFEQMFLVFTFLLHHFWFSSPSGTSPPSLKPRTSTVLAPLPFQLCALPRITKDL